MMYLWDKCPAMAREKKIREKTYSGSKESASTVNEPVEAYQYSIRNTASRTMVLMGMEGKKDLSTIKNDNDLIEVIRHGLPRQAMTNLMQIADLTLTEMAHITHTSDRTLRRYGPNEKLSQEQSERMIELARLYSRGEEAFGTLEAFKDWMDTELLTFNNKKPKEFLDTSMGIRILMDEIGKIEHGIFA